MICDTSEPGCQEVLGIVHKELLWTCYHHDPGNGKPAGGIVIFVGGEVQGHRHFSLDWDVAKAEQDYNC